MSASEDTIWEVAWSRRDPAYDGRFFVGVRTTGIYCRCVCPVRLPLRRKVEFLPSAAAAELAGFRPCLRCRPETAPFCPAWKGTLTKVERAVRLITAEGALDGGATVGDLADRLGITARHLSRLFVRHWGATPGERREDGPSAASQAYVERHHPASDGNRRDSRLWQPAPVQRRVRRGLPAPAECDPPKRAQVTGRFRLGPAPNRASRLN